jgi:ribosomal protein S27AE
MSGQFFRKFNSQRHITLPEDVYDYGWTEKTPLSVTLVEHEMVVIKAQIPFCRVCGEGVLLIPVDEHYICKNCLQTAVDNENAIIEEYNSHKSR